MNKDLDLEDNQEVDSNVQDINNDEDFDLSVFEDNTNEDEQDYDPEDDFEEDDEDQEDDEEFEDNNEVQNKRQKKNGVQKRIDKLVKKSYEQEETIKQLKSLIEKVDPSILQENKTVEKNTQTTQSNQENPPKQEDFEDYDEYKKALISYEVERKVNQVQEKKHKEEVIVQKIMSHKKRIDEFCEKNNKSFDKIQKDPKMIQFATKEFDVMELIVESDVGPEILYYLHNEKDQKTLNKILNSNSNKEKIIVLGSLRDTIKKKRGNNKKVTSSKPAPIQPLNSGKAGSTKAIKTSNWSSLREYEEYMKTRNKRN